MEFIYNCRYMENFKTKVIKAHDNVIIKRLKYERVFSLLAKLIKEFQ